MIDFKEDIENALECLKKGGIILYPTDTIWGLGCDATNDRAVAKIYQLKQREDSKNMLVLIDNELKLRNFVREVPEIAYDLLEMRTKPMTIIYDEARHFAPNLIAEDGSIGIRITDEKFSRHLIERFKIPIVSTSANISGEKSPANFSEINKELIEKADYVVHYRQTDMKKAQASSIIKIKINGEIKIIRE